MFNVKSKPGRSNSADQGRRRARPGLEALEQRAMLSTTAGDRAVAVNLDRANQAYISNLIGTNRDLTPREEALSRRLITALDRGASRADVVTRLLRSGLSYDAQVKSTYLGLLGRAPSANEYRNAIRRLEKTGDDRSLKVALLGTREFYNKKGGGTDAGFLTALYRVVLRRTPTANEQADGLGSVENRSARTTLARRLMNGTEARTIQIQDAYRAAGKLVTTVPTTAFQTLQQPGGLFRITAQALASDDSFRRIAGLGSSPGDTPAPPPPPTGYPVGRGFNLNSSVQPLAITKDFLLFDLVGMSASGDEDVWIASQATLYTYNVQTNTMTDVLDLGAAGRLIWVDAVSSTEAYAILEENSPILHVVVGSSGATQTLLPALPNNALPTQVSAAPDGTVWALAGSGSLFSYNATTKVWSTIDTGGNTLTSLSVGSATNILAISSSGVALRYTSGSGFQPEAALSGSKIQALQATPDGAGWVYFDGILMMKPDYGTWQIVPAAARPTSLNLINGFQPFFVAGSMNRAFILGTTSTTSPLSNLQINMINFGVVDRQAMPFVPYTGAALGIYQSLSQSATIGFNNDIRSLYGQQGEAWSTYLSNLEGAKTPPPNVDPTLWSSVWTELKTELTEVSAIYARLNSIAQTLTEIQVINDGQLAIVGQTAGLYVQNQPSDTILQLVLTDLFEAVLGAVSSTGIAAGYATLAALIAAGADDAINSFQNTNKVGPDDAVPVAFSGLQKAIDGIFTNTLNQLGSDLTSIATDRGKLSAVAGKILSNEWPDPADANIITPTTNAYNVYFYQIMVASRWQVEHSLYGDYIEYPITEILNRVPLWAIGQYPKGYQNGMPIEDVYLINQIGSTSDWNSPSIQEGPFPASVLINGIESLGLTQTYAFWAGLGNWSVIKRLEATF